MSSSEIGDNLARHGLILRGGFAFAPGDAAPAIVGRGPARAVLLIGQRGAEPWPHFEAWLANQSQAIANPLDTWSRQIIEGLAFECGTHAVFPSDKPYLPFQQWAMRAEGLLPSPLGILMHPEYGLWHAYRGALLFDDTAPVDACHDLSPPPAASNHLCALCAGKPCLNACPVGAHRVEGFDYPGCLAYVRSATGGACRSDGCFDRNACPYGTAFRYPADVQAFHMAAFAQ